MGFEFDGPRRARNFRYVTQLHKISLLKHDFFFTLQHISSGNRFLCEKECTVMRVKT